MYGHDHDTEDKMMATSAITNDDRCEGLAETDPNCLLTCQPSKRKGGADKP